MTALRSRYVTVEVAALGGLPAVVESEDDATVVLALAVPAPAGLADALKRPVHVECTTARGIQTVIGTARWDAARPDQLRVRRESAEVVQRRDAARVDVALQAILIAVDGDGGRASTTTVDLSGTGLRIRDPLDLPIGSRARVELEVEAGEPPIVVEGVVVRDAGDGDKGLHLDTIPRRDENRLARFIAERQRAALRIARGG
jgi:hypothetical protein